MALRQPDDSSFRPDVLSSAIQASSSWHCTHRPRFIQYSDDDSAAGNGAARNGGIQIEARGNGPVITSRLVLPLNTPPPAKPVAISRRMLWNLRINHRKDYLEVLIRQFLIHWQCCTNGSLEGNGRRDTRDPRIVL